MLNNRGGNRGKIALERTKSRFARKNAKIRTLHNILIINGLLNIIFQSILFRLAKEPISGYEMGSFVW